MAKKTSNEMQDLKETANKVWLAGLGALASVGEEGGRVFDSLAKKGEGVEERSKEEISRATSKLFEVAGRARSEAKDAWSRLETVLDDRVTAALNRVGVPTRREIQNLSARVAELSKKVERATPRARASRPAARARKARPASTKKR